ncbi:MAG TPA: triose-phosphate isomerase [Candidatus Paceibacterota bacterium]|nr:triose-phosphate isomerase [Candidatus Paceibacterota bacterium]
MGKLIAANWKEHPKTEAQALALFRAVAKMKRGSGAEVAIVPPFIYLEEVARVFKKMSPSSRAGLSLGAQDVFWEEEGAYTSEVGPAMLRSLGAKYVIIGHSERRKFAKETDAMINKKIALAARDGLKIILCVGEPFSVRKQGVAIAKKFVAGQLAKDLKNISMKPGSLYVAYEPIWAIGTGRSDKPEDARTMAIFIKTLLKKSRRISPRFLYGGSVNGRNAADYVQLKDIDGALVGGASLKADEFKKIINAI